MKGRGAHQATEIRRLTPLEAPFENGPVDGEADRSREPVTR